MAAPLLLAVLLHDAAAQTPAPATVVITAPRPADPEGYRATEARIRERLLHQPSLNSPFLSGCMENRFAEENAAAPGVSLPVQDSVSLAYHIRCARVHIEARDMSLRQGLEAFDRRDYPAALMLFEQAYAKMGAQDAALMLAKMHLDGLGTAQDPAAGIEWLREVALDKFDPRRDTLRFDPQHPQAMNARIEAAIMLARIYEAGEGVARDPGQAERWYAKAAEFGFVPALDRPGQTRLAQQDGSGKLPAAIGGIEDVAAVAPPLDDLALPGVAGAPAPAEPSRPAPHDQADPGAFMRVRVTGLRAVPWKSYRAMRAALAAFEAHRSLAPDAVFSFAVIPPAGTRLPSNFKLRVRTRAGREYPIDLADGAMFQLPLLPDPEADADLVSNLKDGPLRIGLLVHTRGVPPEKERLGDVRLRAEIGQAIADVDHPADDPRCRGKHRGHNDCPRFHVSVWFKPRAPASGAWLVEADRREALPSNGDADFASYRIPVNAGHLGNDVTIEFDYKTPPRPMKLNAVLMYDAND